MCCTSRPRATWAARWRWSSDGDAVSLDIPNRKLDLLVPEAEIESRRAQWQRPVPKEQRGYLALYRERVTQAHEGCDFDFLAHDHAAPEPEIF